MTIFLCTYTVLHLDVPHTGGKWRRKLGPRGLKIFAMVGGMLAPEFIACRAILEWRMARDLTNQVRTNNDGWSAWTMMQSHFVLMGGITMNDSRGASYRLSSKNLIRLSENSTIAFESMPTDADIRDRSKADTLSKIITLIQVLWFVMQVISRPIAGLTVSLLELSTTGLVFFAVVSYSMWFSKPFDVTIPIAIPYTELRPPVRLLQFEDHPDYWWTMLMAASRTNVALWIILNAVFAGIHSAAWKYVFASKPEAVIWHVCSILIFVLPLLEGYSFLAISRNRFPDGGLGSAIGVFIELLFPLLYVIARLFLIVETLIAFRFCPASIFDKVRWMEYLAHFG